ncbi:hypothetical protein MMC27_000496 [Xylographa pallens]|nr:hypothetical protein [Xylographa pallens]
MDPVTGIGLAASVIQLVTFSIDAAKICREAYQQGSVSEYSNLDYTTGHLASLTRTLQQSLQSSSTRSLVLASEEKDLVDLAQKCHYCANKLQKELHKLHTQPRASALDAAQQTARAIWKKSSIDRIYKQLQVYQSTLETSLLSRLSQRFDTQGLRIDKSFANLDRYLQHIITCLANCQTSLKALVVQESEETRHCITMQIDRLQKTHIDDCRYNEIIASLFYPDISSRQEQVDHQFDGIRNSYDWIFKDSRTCRSGSSDEPPQERAPRWDNFACWLKSGHGVYWINGKTGSGKSTLMNYICTQKHRLDLLKEWCSNRQVLTPVFFFWNSGCRGLTEYIDNDPLHTWTQSRLLATLLNLLRQSQVPLAVCMFIDGLDEFDGPSDTVIGMITDLADQTHVKICVSSRPLLAFEKAFNGKPNLKLQDLTFSSIREYAEVKLSKLIQERVSLGRTDGHLAEDLLTRIVERADGVFLWVIIAIREVREGLEELADINELAQMVEFLPSELEKLFVLMLDRIKPAYKRDAARFLQTVLQMYGIHSHTIWFGMDLCTLHFSHSQRELRDTPFVYEEIATSELVTACRTMKTRLLSHTGGLLELTPTNEGDRIYGEKQDLDPVLFTQINFLHRTVRDFLLNNAEAKSRLALSGSTEAQVCLSIAKGTLAQVAHFSQGKGRIIDKNWPSPAYFPFLASLHEISQAERLLNTAQAQLMRSLDFEIFAREYPVSNNPKSFDVTAAVASFMTNPVRTSIDLVGMAAAVGMTIYVCEQLDLPNESQHYSPSLPDYSMYFKNKATAATLCWNGDNQLRNPGLISATGLRSPNYRQTLASCLQWEPHKPLNSRTAAPMDIVLLAETYMLSCCTPTCLDLIRILLQAGANPMVRVKSPPTNQYACIPFTSKCFWNTWVIFLLQLRYNYIKANGKSGGILINGDSQITLNDIFGITKALLVHGADINYQIKYGNSDDYGFYLKRRGLEKEPFNLILTSSAIFTLEECFNTEPEFHEFMIAMKPLIRTPTRNIVGIVKRNSHFRSGPHDTVTCPSAEESEALWPLIEKWESTGRRDDQDSLQAALEAVFIAHKSDND